MPSQALQIGNNSASPSFVQQGQIDWVAFAKSTVSASVSVMQRCSAAGVQPVTVAGGLALGSRFELDKKGTQNMDVTLKKLDGVLGFDKLLYFGFGYKSFVNILAETKVGINLMALCACLVDMHGIPFAADVLTALWKIEGFPEDFEPSRSQFNALATSCAGIVATTVFGQIADMMMGDLRNLAKPSKLSLTQPNSTLPRALMSDPEDVAKALHGLFEVSRAAKERIELVGGLNCSFIGAYAHWLLNLSVEIEDNDGNLIYLDASDRNAAQVRIQYCDMDQLSTDLRITSTTYVLRDRATIFQLDEQYDLALKVRTPWDGCLKRAFWDLSDLLTNASTALGRFLGNTARVYAALASGESISPIHDIESTKVHAEGTYGYGFIDKVGSTFPELSRLTHFEATVLMSLEKSPEQALDNLQNAMDSLIDLCRCTFCLGVKKIEQAPETLVEDEEASVSCLLVTAATITSLVRLVAVLKVHATINPTIVGLQQFYERCEDWTSREIAQPRRPILKDLFKKMSCQMEHGEQPLQSVIAGTLRLFTGARVDESYLMHERYCALSSAGICCYLEAINCLSSDAAILSHLHVLPGRIQKGNHEYIGIKGILDQSSIAGLPEAKLSLESIAPPSDFRRDSIEIKALVRDYADGPTLGFCYEARFSGMCVRIDPYDHTADVLSWTGLTQCKRQTCSEKLVIPRQYVETGWGLVPYIKAFESDRERYNADAFKCFVWPFREDDVGRCIALKLARSTMEYQQESQYIVHFRNGECLACSMRAAKKETDSTISNNIIIII